MGRVDAVEPFAENGERRFGKNPRFWASCWLTGHYWLINISARIRRGI
jgi:hypothetical protein